MPRRMPAALRLDAGPQHVRQALGAGFPVGAVAGPRAILDRMRWGNNMVLHYGTFNGHRLTMRVIAANLDMLAANEGAVYKQIHEIGDAALPVCVMFFAEERLTPSFKASARCFRLLHWRDAIRDYRDYCSTPTRQSTRDSSTGCSIAHLHDAFERIALDNFDRAYRAGCRDALAGR